LRNLSEMMPYIWMGVIVFAAITKIHAFSFTPVLFIFSAFTAFVLSLTKYQVWVQVLIFFVMTLILIILSKTIFKRFIKIKSANINSTPNLFIGKNALVTHEINNYKNTGAVRINGFSCSAQADDDDIIYETGLIVTVIRIDGEKAVCTR